MVWTTYGVGDDYISWVFMKVMMWVIYGVGDDYIMWVHI